MSKRLYFILALGLVLVTGVGLGIIWWWSWLPARNAITEEEVAKKYVEMHGQASLQQDAPAWVPISLSRSLRLAVGGFGLSNENSNQQLGDLVTVQLNDAAGFELVERQSLAAILRELNLNWSGFVRAKDAIRAGKLLKVDWFLLGTEAKINGTNSILARVVEARTGAIYDAGVFPADLPLPVTATNLASFLRDSRQRAAHPQPRIFLAFGTIQDLSVNNRQAAFPQQLRSYLTAAFQGRNVTLLEREYVETLLQEMRLDLAGMTEESWSNPPTAMQSAYWLVDGQYQSYETTNYQIELNLTIQRAFGKSFQRQLCGAPGDPICRQAKRALDEVMSRNASYGYPTRRGEARMQMEMGKELGQLGNWPFFIGNGYYEPQDARSKRRRADAVHAFQTVLLLEPNNREAKMALAACLRKSGIEHEAEARNIYREVLEEPLRDKWTDLAKNALTETFAWAGTAEEARWYAAAIQSCTNATLKEFYRQHASQASRDEAINRGNEDSIKLAYARLLDQIRSSKNFWDHQNSTLYGGYGLYDFQNAFPTKAAGAQAMADILPELEKQFPELAPHLAAYVLSFQMDSNSPVLPEFERTLDWCLAHPQEVFQARNYWDGDTSETCRWLIRAQQFALAIKILEGCRAAAEQKLIEKFGDDHQLALGYAYMGAERWQDALTTFESFSNKIVRAMSDGPWGKAYQPVLTETNAAFCRQKLGLAAVEDTRKFDLGKSVVCLASFSTDQDGLWIGIGRRLLRLDFELKTNLNLQLPMDDSATVTAICPTADKIWIGTSGAGLIEFEKTTSQFHRLTDTDGLMMNDITSLEVTGNSLWIGYGGSAGGGLGRMDLLSGKINSFTPSLNPATNSAGESAPRNAIGKIVTGANGDLWMLAGNDVRQYLIKPNIWKSWPRHTDGWLGCFDADTMRLVEGFSVTLLDIGIEDKFDRNNPTKDLHQTNLVVSTAELNVLEKKLLTTGSNRRIYMTALGGHRPKGGLAICNLHDNSWTFLDDPTGFPNPPTTLTLNGDNLWVGCEGSIALVNLKEKKVKKFCHLKANRVDNIQIAGGYVWAQLDQHLYRVPLSTLQ